MQEYYAIAAASRDFSEKVSALARERLGGTSELGCQAEQAARDVNRPALGCCVQRSTKIPGPQPDFFQLARPRRAGVGDALAWASPAGRRRARALLADGQVIAQPNVRDVANRLGLQTSARSDEYDVAIIGGGPAGLAAAVYGASEGLQTIVIEREAPGGQAGTSSRIENYLGFPNGSQGTNSPIARFNKPDG